MSITDLDEIASYYVRERFRADEAKSNLTKLNAALVSKDPRLKHKLPSSWPTSAASRS